MSSLDLDAKHRQERKELQAKIQSLKKVLKGDKTKKKEITQEIADLEFEQETRHKKELDEALTETTSGKIEDELSENDAQSKSKSKAQKRREKKELEEKERAQRIKEQERENLVGPRITEEKSIAERLKAKRLSLFTVPSDGDCLYKAVSHQLGITGRNSLSVKDLRSKTAKYIQENKDDFLPFMTNPDTLEVLTNDEFESYCYDVASTKFWGGQLEIRALSNILKCPITVIQATGPDVIEQGIEFGDSPLVITYHRHMYKLGEHYNSTQPEIEENSE